MAFQSIDFERTWWRLFQKRVVYTKFDIYIFMYQFYTYNVYNLHACNVQYSQRHTMINHCDRCITLLSELDISFVLLNISSKFLLHLECYLLSPKRHIRISKCIKQTKIYISITKKSDMSITDLSRYVSDCTVYLLVWMAIYKHDQLCQFC